MKFKVEHHPMGGTSGYEVTYRSDSEELVLAQESRSMDGRLLRSETVIKLEHWKKICAHAEYLTDPNVVSEAAKAAKRVSDLRYELKRAEKELDELT